jgi:hypothetical protein
MSKRLYLITETLADTLITYSVIKRLVKPWEEWDAFKLGIIDASGEMIKTPTSSKELEAWTSLDKFTRNLKRVMQKFVGKGKLAHYMTMLYLLRDSLTGLSHNRLDEDYEDFTAAKQLKIYQIFKEMDLLYVMRDTSVDLEYDTEIHVGKMRKILDELEITEEDLIC